MINVEKIVKFQQFGDRSVAYTTLFLDDGSTIDVKGGRLDVDRRITAAAAGKAE